MPEVTATKTWILYQEQLKKRVICVSTCSVFNDAVSSSGCIPDLGRPQAVSQLLARLPENTRQSLPTNRLITTTNPTACKDVPEHLCHPIQVCFRFTDVCTSCGPDVKIRLATPVLTVNNELEMILKKAVVA